MADDVTLYEALKDGSVPSGYEIRQADVGQDFGDGFGEIRQADVGKKCWLKPYGLVLENTEQRDARKLREQAQIPKIRKLLARAALSIDRRSPLARQTLARPDMLDSPLRLIVNDLLALDISEDEILGEIGHNMILMLGYERQQEMN